ncbi:uncharacterized protein LOC121425633 [Lytechinus variegatus]|uniref:uncharacterized protein LOC121425633 n=1 Tax=Lytechinus variegatus TaxID=7654 RepID=UPI001BB2359D|nr:uncharacterized protein LOC121425633 [Lytechinus variegatus]
MADSTETKDITSLDIDHRTDVAPTLEEALNIFAGYNAGLANYSSDSKNNDNDFEVGPPDRGKPSDYITGIVHVDKDFEDDLQNEKDFEDPNCNLVNTWIPSQYLPSWVKPKSGYKPAIPVIAEDTFVKQHDEELVVPTVVIDQETVEDKSTSESEPEQTAEHPKSNASTTNDVASLDGVGPGDEMIAENRQIDLKERRHSLDNLTNEMKVKKNHSTDDELNRLKLKDGSHGVEKNNNRDAVNLMEVDTRDPKTKVPSSLPSTPRLLTPPCPFSSNSLSGNSRRPRRYSLADVSNMGLSVLEDKAFAREIRQHQISLQSKIAEDSIIEANNEVGNDVHEADKAETSSSSVDLTSPRERAKYLRRRRASHGTIAPILPSLHLPRSPRSSVVYNPSTTPELEGASDDHEDDKGASSSTSEAKDESTLSESEHAERLKAYRRNKRRSSWACTGTHPHVKPISTIDLLRQSKIPQESQWNATTSHDPYHITVHFITDPGQADRLRNFLRPITSAIVPQFAIFNYAERSISVHPPEPDDDDHTKIPALAIVVFIQEELGADRLEDAQGFLRKEPWALHHRSELGPSAVPYPTNNQDYYAHANNMPLWAVRQVHCGSDRLRFQLFVSDEHWFNSIQLYATILGHGVQYQKEDFCFFNIYSDPTRNLEIQLSLKRLPSGYTPQPMEDVILQFKIADMGSLVPLLPNVCSPISEKRWQTTDFDGNKILLLRGSDRSGKSTPRIMDNSGLSNRGTTEGGASSPVPSDNGRSRSRQRGRRHKHGMQNLTTVV